MLSTKMLFLLSIVVQSVLCSPLFMPNESWTSGYVPVDQNPANALFYLLERSRTHNSSTPLLVWLNGGPGSSSMVGAFEENGAYPVHRKRLEFFRNPFAWNEVFDVAFVDQPVGVGFSTASSSGRFCDNETCVARDFYKFLLGFVEKNPEYLGRDLYVTGESYAGRYIPAIAAYILKAGNSLNLKGVAIGNGFLTNGDQAGPSPGFLFDMGIISYITYILGRAGALLCQIAELVGYSDALTYGVCNDGSYSVINLPNEFDIRENSSYDDVDKVVEAKLNEKSVQQLLGVDMNFSLSASGMEDLFIADSCASSFPDVEYMLGWGLPVLFYYGDQDYICNWKGGERAVHHLNWAGKTEFNAEEYHDWMVDGGSEKGGMYKRHRNLVLATVKDAGHLVPLNQPRAALSMIRRFVYSGGVA